MIEGTIKKLENSEIEIIGSISAEKFESYKQKAIKDIGEHINLDGFRKGHIPEDVLIKEVGEMTILEEMAEAALRDAYPKFIIENKIEAIGRPNISITKIAKNNPLEFKIVTAVMPVIGDTNHKNVAKSVWGELSKEKLDVTDKEVEDVVMEIRKARAKKDDGHKCEDEHCKENHDKEKNPPTKAEEAPLPELNDEFVKSIGNFTGVEDFKEKIKKNIGIEKESAQKEKARTQILDKIIEKTKFTIPEVLIKGETNQILHELRGKIEQLGLDFEEYLKQTKKTEEDVRKEAKEPAEKRVKYKLILKAIAKEENIQIPQEEVMKEVENLLKYYEGADMESAKSYVEDTMINEKVFELLESNK
ncbi:MAG TPA: trigger factor [Candidatus Paceibacterota bacterium]|nr:trigger factor [Candidatus Paceibacterota bacterium]